MQALFAYSAMVPRINTYLKNIHCIFAHTNAHPLFVLRIPKDMNNSGLVRLKDDQIVGIFQDRASNTQSHFQ